MAISWHDGPCCANWAMKWSHMVWQKPNYKLPSQEIEPSASLMLNFSQWLLAKRTIQPAVTNILKHYKYFSNRKDAFLCVCTRISCLISPYVLKLISVYFISPSVHLICIKIEHEWHLIVTSWLTSCSAVRVYFFLFSFFFHESQPIKRLFKGHLAFKSGRSLLCQTALTLCACVFLCVTAVSQFIRFYNVCTDSHITKPRLFKQII